MIEGDLFVGRYYNARFDYRSIQFNRGLLIIRSLDLCFILTGYGLPYDMLLALSLDTAFLLTGLEVGRIDGGVGLCELADGLFWIVAEVGESID